jgi:hypothetical protein
VFISSILFLFQGIILASCINHVRILELAIQLSITTTAHVHQNGRVTTVPVSEFPQDIVALGTQGRGWGVLDQDF